MVVVVLLLLLSGGAVDGVQAHGGRSNIEL